MCVQILKNQQHLAACYLVIEYTIAAISQSDALTDDDVSSILPKLLDMFHGCIFLIDQIVDSVENKTVSKMNMTFRPRIWFFLMKGFRHCS